MNKTKGRIEVRLTHKDKVAKLASKLGMSISGWTDVAVNEKLEREGKL